MRVGGWSFPVPATIRAASRRFLSALLFAVLLLLSGGNALAQGSVATDREALVALYDATDGANWDSNNNWLSSGPVTGWYGVGTDLFTDEPRRVTGLNLISNGLTGTIPAELGNLTNLESLYLGRNRLTGTIPAELGNLTNLHSLGLGANQLSGTIPAELGNLNNLLGLGLDHNQLSGTIPVALGSLSSLQHLGLSANQLMGEIPAELDNLSSLQHLGLSENQLMGEIPAELGNLTNLEVLYLNNNQLSGTIPAELGNLTNLRWLWLHNNQLSGPIPAELGNLTNLQRLRLDGTTGLCLASDFPLTSPFAMRSLYLPVCTTGDGPGPPRNLVVDGGNEQITLSWDAPESDGGTAITDYEYRIDGSDPWISTGSTDTTYTVAGLVNGRSYGFEVRAVNSAGSGASSNRAEATPKEVFTLDFAHFANGDGITSDLVLVNPSTERSRRAPTPFHSDILPVRPAVYFYDTEGNSIAAESVVDITGDLEIWEDGGLSILTEMEPLGVLTISTHGRGELVTGSVRVVADKPIGGVLRFDLPGIGIAGVGASSPVSDAIFPVRRQAGGISTAAAVHNVEEEAIVVTCRLMSAGTVLEEVEIPLEAGGQDARFIEQMFTTTDTSDFVGVVRCSAAGLFTGVAVELDAANRLLTTLPVVPVLERNSQE